MSDDSADTSPVRTTRSSRRDRESLPDALRALAMLSVLVMNAIGYGVAPWGHPLGGPPAGPWSAAAQGLAAALLQGKGYTMLAFVFGMALWLAARGRPRAQALQRGIVRHRRMLQLGVLHGVFIYFGDILTMYALVGRRLLRRLHVPWKAFRRHLRIALVWALLAKAVLVAMMLSPPVPPNVEVQGTLGSVVGLAAFLRANAGTYLVGQVMALVIAAPVIHLCMLAGVAAARLRLLTHRRWRAALRRYVARAAAILLVPTLLYGWASATWAPTDPLRAWLDALGDLIALPLATVYLAALGLASAGGTAAWCRRLVPLGQRTLTLYVLHGLLCVALFSGIGLALQPSAAQMVAYCLALWSLAWVAAALSGGRRWPLEAWMARR
jgi:uncharacterized protein